jgi:hypothetical protein
MDFRGGMTQTQIGQRLRMSQMQVSRLRSHALGYLRSRLLDLDGTSAVMHLTARIRCLQRRHPGAGLSPRSVRSENAFCLGLEGAGPLPSTLLL